MRRVLNFIQDGSVLEIPQKSQWIESGSFPHVQVFKRCISMVGEQVETKRGLAALARPGKRNGPERFGRLAQQSCEISLNNHEQTITVKLGNAKCH